MQMMKRMERSSYPKTKKKSSTGSQKRGRMPELQMGNEFDVEIKELGHNGDGMVKIEGFTVFVSNVSVGEKVKIKIVKVKDTIAWAKRLD